MSMDTVRFQSAFKFKYESGSCMRAKCPFCDFQDNDVVIWKEDTVFAVLSRSPINKYHALIIPRRHYESFTDLPVEIAVEVFLLARRVSRAVRLVCHPDAITHLSDDEISWKGFNQVAHYKFHVIPRFKGDNVEVDWHRERDPGLRVRVT